MSTARSPRSCCCRDGVPEFEGVLARAVMDAVGARGSTLVASALNDYQNEIPMHDFQTYPVLFALKMDGQELTVRALADLDSVSER